MSKTGLDMFGRLITESLRDRAIAHYDGLAHNHWKAPALMNLQQELQSFDERQRSIIRQCVISAIDTGIHDFLFRVQELAEFDKSIQIIVDGIEISSTSDGLQGELFGKEGWFAKYSSYDHE